MPASLRRRTGHVVRSSPSSVIRPPCWTSRSPRMASISSPWPFPSTPATPRISPRRTSKSTPSRTVRPASSTIDTLCSRRVVWSSAARGSVDGVGSSEPTINSASSGAVTWLGSTVATVRPCRSTVTVSAMASTSSNLWSMNRIVWPRALSSRRLRNSSSTSWGTRTAVGSSRMRIRAPRYSTLMISTRWRSPTSRVSTRSSG